MCGDNHWPTLLIRLCTRLRSQLAVLLARVSEVWANLKPFLLPLVRISPHDPILSCLRALLSGGEGEGQIWPRHGRFIRADHPIRRIGPGHRKTPAVKSRQSRSVSK
jgi:hypothetical protein